MSVDAERIVAQAATEMEKLGTTYELSINLPLIRWIAISAMIQLAMRHPDVKDTLNYKAGRAFVDGLIELVGRKSPILADFMRLGDDPKYDSPPTEPAT